VLTRGFSAGARVRDAGYDHVRSGDVAGLLGGAGAARPPCASCSARMMNEGAGKGSWSRRAISEGVHSFAKDKPITLVDGANLLHLM
jgi:hypothetical protein